ncbi:MULTISPECIES: hypothetical protein [unclassified Streptomyces]|uniref:hypothetical protein n=1 Tax=unclassified Streptomyces TaxID=2593676 RepID=UPI002DDC0BD3|nr:MULTISPECIES: hypothetical protein [unclassified Streptomyces]WSA90205.1 hypothetical protein OIE63_00645 [Streptomyces sp. NBC_01795]WSB74432.1 hypothetical protein OHB04_00640 [Streptomyces sp. NBC_01775]WSS17185.1 hypothetical protein OG533_38755 [Streptomyces sp. NBC_01186]WSS45931.1 hypothetical protein OG220_39015 [Streptomyces sp. NBC_01187]
MRSRSARLAATAAAVAILGTLATAAPAAAATSTPATAGTASVQGANAWHFIDWYPSKEACERGGAYYLRHGYSGYRCEMDLTRGWALMVAD